MDSSNHAEFFDIYFNNFKWIETHAADAVRAEPKHRGPACQWAAQEMKEMRRALAGMRHHEAHIDYDDYQEWAEHGDPGPEEMRARNLDRLRTAEIVSRRLTDKFLGLCARVK